MLVKITMSNGKRKPSNRVEAVAEFNISQKIAMVTTTVPVTRDRWDGKPANHRRTKTVRIGRSKVDRRMFDFEKRWLQKGLTFDSKSVH